MHTQHAVQASGRWAGIAGRARGQCQEAGARTPEISGLVLERLHGLHGPATESFLHGEDNKIHAARRNWLSRRKAVPLRVAAIALLLLSKMSQSARVK